MMANRSLNSLMSRASQLFRQGKPKKGPPSRCGAQVHKTLDAWLCDARTGEQSRTACLKPHFRTETCSRHEVDGAAARAFHRTGNTNRPAPRFFATSFHRTWSPRPRNPLRARLRRGILQGSPISPLLASLSLVSVAKRKIALRHRLFYGCSHNMKKITKIGK